MDSGLGDKNLAGRASIEDRMRGIARLSAQVLHELELRLSGVRDMAFARGGAAVVGAFSPAR